MTLIQIKKAFQAGRMVLSEALPVEAKSDFQKRRIEQAIEFCIMYLGNEFSLPEMGKLMGDKGVTKQRAQQVLKLGMDHILKSGRLKPVERRPRREADPS